MAFPNWLTGPGITTIQVTAQEVVAGILVTPAATDPIDFFTVIDGIEYDHRVSEVEVGPTNSRQENWVTLTTGGHWTLTEIMRRSPYDTGHSFNSLAALAHEYDYFRIVFTRGTRTFVQYAKGSGYSERHLDQSAARATMRFSPAGVVPAGVVRNPSYT